MHPNQIMVGRFYVNLGKRLVREIVNETADGVDWRAYELSDGTPSPGGSGRCLKSTTAQWADREATPQEISRLHIHDWRMKEMKGGMQLIGEVLKNCPDEYLEDELRRRGYAIDR